MRPRVFPAEDVVTALTLHSMTKASMRPRVFPAEDALQEFGLFYGSTLQ